LPAGTTVSSVSGALVTLSQNATATTGVVTTGTIQGNYTQIVVSSATGIAPGMTVSGNYLPAGAQVVAVSGTTITLGTPVDPTQLFSVVGSASGTVIAASVYFALGTSLTVGWFIASSLLPLNRFTQIANVRSVTRLGVLSRNQFVITNTVADLTQNTGISNQTATWTFYIPTAIPSATYTFFATDQSYTFRANANLPFGSFPGIGTYTT